MASLLAILTPEREPLLLTSVMMDTDPLQYSLPHVTALLTGYQHHMSIIAHLCQVAIHWEGRRGERVRGGGGRGGGGKEVGGEGGREVGGGVGE